METDDGFVISLHRIPAQTAGAPVVFLVHAFLCSAFDWVSRGPGTSLALLLWDLGKLLFKSLVKFSTKFKLCKIAWLYIYSHWTTLRLLNTSELQKQGILLQLSNKRTLLLELKWKEHLKYL